MQIVILIALLIMAIQDYKFGEVSNLLYLPLLFFIKFNIYIIALFIIVLIIYPLIKKYIGGADIKITFIFLLIFPYNDVLTWLTCSFLLATIVALIMKKKSIRMFPYFFISYLGFLL